MLIKDFQVFKNARNNLFFFILKLMLIILLNKTFAYIAQDIETTILPIWKPIKRNEISLTLKTFGKQIQLNLCNRNDKTASSAFKVWEHDAKGKTEKLSQLNVSDSCYYHHNDNISSAVINFCQEYGWEGLVFLDNDTLEIKPLRNNFASLTLIDNSCVKEKTNISFGKSHLIKRLSKLFANSSFYNMDLNNLKVKRQVQDTEKKLTIELAVFFDEAAYNTFMPILNKDKKKLRNMILAYVNNMQALFHHQSLGSSIDISLVHLEIMDKQPLDLSVSNVHEIKLLDLFCKYANTHNPPNDTDPGHWDIALYLTGLDIYGTKNQEVSFHSVGAAETNSICNRARSCAIIEFGVDHRITSGFSSSLTAVHEIGHILGMEHDSDLCNSRDYIMASLQYSGGQLTWSKCSSNITKTLWNEKQCLRDRTTPENVTKYEYDHSRYFDLPGRKWNAKAQCEIYFHDKDANVVSLLDICQTLQCEMSNKINFAGPALRGTHCAHGKECRDGECVPIIESPYNFKCYKRDNWSKWKTDSCKSECLEKSKGVLVKRRFCTHQTYKTANCKKPYYDVILCDDSSYCANKFRLPISNFTKIKCAEFSSQARKYNLPLEILQMPGKQDLHNVQKPWIACTIICQRTLTHHARHGYKQSDYYAPRLEMLNIGIDPYFPDGTWCHHEDGHDYYCRQHYCLPESYS